MWKQRNVLGKEFEEFEEFEMGEWYDDEEEKVKEDVVTEEEGAYHPEDEDWRKCEDPDGYLPFPF